MIPEPTIRNAEQTLIDRTWFDDQHLLLDRVGHLQEDAPPEDELDAIGAEMRALEARYGVESLRPMCEHGYEFVRGQLDALKWVLGDSEALSAPPQHEGGDVD